MKTKILMAVAALFAVALIAAFSYAPTGVKSYVEKNYPGVTVNDVDLDWGSFTFHSVTVDREGLKGLLRTVQVRWTTEGVQDIEVSGGSIFMDKKTTKASDALKQPLDYKLSGKDLSVGFKSPEAEAVLKNVRFDAERVCFDEGTIAPTLLPKPVEVKNGCFTRTGTEVTADNAWTYLEMPVDLPDFTEGPQRVSIDGLKLDIPAKKLTFKAAEALPLFKVLNESSVDTSHVDLNGLWVDHEWIAPEPVVFDNVNLAHNPEGIGIDLNHQAVVVVDPKAYSLKGENTCEQWLAAMPNPLPDALQQAKGHFTGVLNINVMKDPRPSLGFRNECKFECSAEPIASLLKALRKGGDPIVYQAYDKDDNLFPRNLGPSTKDWVSLSRMPEFLPKAFITLEDPGFRGHHGILPQALENSFKDNLKLGKFFRGGSTISMQLAKNLWLKRYKTLGRKAQEFLLTIALESCLSKDEILALYLNAVEFGPNLYGIGPASQHYFGKGVERLDKVEAFYLASLLPHPRKAVMPGKGGLERARRLMVKLAQNGFLSEEDLEEVPVPEEVDSTGWATE